ncbi:folate-binding protein YgfZ [Azospirillum sp. TSO22-1]|uniref:CAF17-like 4Fe-4S cluster assembly/insertion protein YgfZ n=1 Tax=Azospirillum sp. TSO22-1 TaxID=716789 RepID=UPI000D6118CE|nr:folate-binding protein YgfZ [Azospirillum sp. TSO22-1]PWC43835.1 glycine cleavage system protein T [Azospirillum sp. TSO22-1]
MAETTGYVVLEQRGVLAVTGEDRVAFLQGLVSNDMQAVTPERAVYSLFLTPQGKYLHDFMVAAEGDALLLEVEAARRDDLLKRLRMYKLRSKIALEDRTAERMVVALVGPDALARAGLPAEPGAAGAFAGGVAFTDPRTADLGARAILPAGTDLAALGLGRLPFEAWDSRRLELGIPDGSRDLEVEKAIPLENNLDVFNAISWDKGCYMGQELTARTRYRALIKKKLVPVTLDGPLPAPGTPVRLGDQEVGEMRSGLQNRALAMLRLEDLDRAAKEQIAFQSGDTMVTPHTPS